MCVSPLHWPAANLERGCFLPQPCPPGWCPVQASFPPVSLPLCMGIDFIFLVAKPWVGLQRIPSLPYLVHLPESCLSWLLRLHQTAFHCIAIALWRGNAYLWHSCQGVELHTFVHTCLSLPAIWNHQREIICQVAQKCTLHYIWCVVQKHGSMLKCTQQQNNPFSIIDPTQKVLWSRAAYSTPKVHRSKRHA